MRKPLRFDYETQMYSALIGDPFSIQIEVECEEENDIHVFEKETGVEMSFAILPETDKQRIKQRVKDHFFMEEATRSSW